MTWLLNIRLVLKYPLLQTLNPILPECKWREKCFYNVDAIRTNVFFYFMSFQKGVSTEKLLEKQIRINQLSVSAARWQHLSQICFANLILWKVTKFSITQQSLKLEKNKYRFEFLRIFILKFMHEGLNFKTIKILLNKISHWFLLTTITIKKKLNYITNFNFGGKQLMPIREDSAAH